MPYQEDQQDKEFSTFTAQETAQAKKRVAALITSSGKVDSSIAEQAVHIESAPMEMYGHADCPGFKITVSKDLISNRAFANIGKIAKDTAAESKLSLDYRVQVESDKQGNLQIAVASTSKPGALFALDQLTKSQSLAVVS